MKVSLSFFHRFLTAIVGVIIGGLVGMLAFYLVMLVVGSDFGLDNVRPGVVLGAGVGFSLVSSGLVAGLSWASWLHKDRLAYRKQSAL